MSIPTSAAGGSGSHTERSKEKIQFLRELYSAARGDTTLDVYSDALARKLNQDENVAMGNSTVGRRRRVIIKRI